MAEQQKITSLDLEFWMIMLYFQFKSIVQSVHDGIFFATTLL